MHVPVAAARPADKPREERHGEDDRQGSEQNAAEHAHASEHIGSQGSRPSC
jgi:hypothetical protein